MKLYIFRHGQTYFSKNDIPYEDQVETAEILDEGIPVVKKLARYLKDIPTDKNFTSPFKRCVQTSEIVTKITGKKFEIQYDLRDWDPRVETIPQMIERVKDFAYQLQTTEYLSVSICTHGYPINALIAYFTRGHIREADLHNFPSPGVLVSIEDKKVSYKDFN